MMFLRLARRAASVSPSENLPLPLQSALSCSVFRMGKNNAVPEGMTMLRFTGVPVKFPPRNQTGPL